MTSEKKKSDVKVAAALVVSMDSVNLKIGDGCPCVIRFPNEEAAEEWAFKRLVEFNELAVNPDGSIWSGDRQERYEDRSEALAEWQFCNLGASEYFHVYECHEVDELESVTA